MSTGSQAKENGSAPGASSPGGPRRLNLGVILGMVGLLSALARLPLIRDPVDVSPDGCEYLNIARHLAFEHRWISSLKWNFFTDSPVTHPALADRPPLFPLWAAGWMALSDQPGTQIWLARLGNLLLAAAVPPLIYWSLRAAVLPAAAALAALIFLLYPAFLRISSQPLTEPLFLVLLFSSLGIFLRAHSPWEWAACGFLAELASLTRPSGLLLPLVYGGALLGRWTVVSGHYRRPLLLMVLGFALPLLPYGIAVAAQTGSPFTSILRYNYSIRHIDEGTFYGFERAFAPPAVFVKSHAAEVARLVAQQWSTMGWALGRSLQFMLPLGLFWRRRGAGWGQTVLISVALLNFLFHALSWTVWGAARYMFPTYIIGLALLMDAPLRWVASVGNGVVVQNTAINSGNAVPRSAAGRVGRQRLATGAVAMTMGLTLATCLEQDFRLYQEKRQPFAGVPLAWAYAAAARRLAGTPPGATCASNQPWILSLLAQRPAVMAPRFRDAAQLRRYLARYRPETLTLFVTEREPGDVSTARRLVENLWTQPMLKPELRDVLDLEKVELRASHRPLQALLIFRVWASGSARRGER